MVVTLHCLTPSDAVVKNSVINSSLYYMGTLAIPVFFMASGYFVLNKRTISYNYSFIRIKNILIVVIAWVFLFSFIQLIFKHHFDFINQLLGSAFVGIKGERFYHFWFFWALMIMLLIAPLLWYLLQNRFKLYLILLIIMTMVCVGLDLMMHFGYTKIVQNTPQVFRLNTWIEYYMIGGLIGNNAFKKLTNFISQNFLFLTIVDVFLYIIYIIYALWNRNIIHWVYAEANYNNVLVIIISTLSLCLFSVALFNSKIQRTIEFIIPATMGIYIIHPFFIGKFSKLFIFNSYPVLMIIAIFIICFIIVETALRIPVVNKLFKL